jgi:hypothetical protein
LGVLSLYPEHALDPGVCADKDPRVFAATPYYMKFFIEVRVGDWVGKKEVCPGADLGDSTAEYW